MSNQRRNIWVPGNSGSPVTCSELFYRQQHRIGRFVQTGNINQGESEIPAGEGKSLT
jgi:hypothetical protein